MRSREDFRDWHYLRPLQGTAVPSSLLFFDTETIPVKDTSNKSRTHHHLRLWIANAFRYDGGKATREETETGDTAEGFWDFACRRTDKKRPLWIFAHNIGFDLTVLGFWDLLLSGDFEFRQFRRGEDTATRENKKPLWSGISVMNDPPSIFKFRMKGTTNTIVAVDSYNYFRTSLEEIGTSIDMPKGKMPPFQAHNKAWADYCLQDVKILRTAVTSFIDLVKREGLGKMAYTISGQAINAYRARFMPGDRPILVHGNRSAIQLERESFHSGAVHCWYVGRVCKANKTHTHKGPRGRDIWCLPGPLYAFDVQSFYPSLMATNVFPRKLIQVVRRPSYEQFGRDLGRYGTVARVAIGCKLPGFPVTRQGKTFYATGTFTTTLAGPELYRAYCENAILRVDAYATYEQANLFETFVTTLWDMRQRYAKDGNRAFAYACKLLMNSLYGRFGMKKYKWEDRPEVLPPFPFGYWWERTVKEDELKCYRAMCWLPQIQCTAQCDDHACNGRECINPGHCRKNPLEYIDSFPLISSYITAYGRERLLQMAQVAGIDNCVYADTDSLHVNEAGAARLSAAGLIETGVLGKLRLTDTIVTAEYRGPKDYTINGRNVIAGIKPDAKKRGAGRFEQTRFQRLSSILAGNELNSVAVDTIVVPRPLSPPTGRVDREGRVEPVLLKEW